VRLLYLLTEPFGVGGVQSDILALTEDLTRRGHEVYVATTPGVLLAELQGKGAHFVEIDFHFGGLAGFFRAARALRRLVLSYRIELVAPQSVRSSAVAWFALRGLPGRNRAALRAIPLVTTIHNIHTPRHFGYVGRLLDATTDFVIFESNYERSRVIAGGLPADKTTVIHSGIDTERFVPRRADPELAARYGIDPGRHKVFGVVARLSPEKGHGYLLEAFARVRAVHPAARLLLIGDGPLREELLEHCRRLGLTEAIVFAGLQRDVPAHLALLDVFVLASTRESFPLAAREAMAAGRAVIAPRIGGCPEVVVHGETGLLFEAGNVDDLANQMLAMLADGAAAEFGAAGRRRCERLFSRRAWIEGDERVYLDSRCLADAA
jgi:L-malate glycosyltransferase